MVPSRPGLRRADEDRKLYARDRSTGASSVESTQPGPRLAAARGIQLGPSASRLSAVEEEHLGPSASGTVEEQHRRLISTVSAQIRQHLLKKRDDDAAVVNSEVGGSASATTDCGLPDDVVLQIAAFLPSFFLFAANTSDQDAADFHKLCFSLSGVFSRIRSLPGAEFLQPGGYFALSRWMHTHAAGISFNAAVRARRERQNRIARNKRIWTKASANQRHHTPSNRETPLVRTYLLKQILERWCGFPSSGRPRERWTLEKHVDHRQRFDEKLAQWLLTMTRDGDATAAYSSMYKLPYHFVLGEALMFVAIVAWARFPHPRDMEHVLVDCLAMYVDAYFFSSSDEEKRVENHVQRIERLLQRLLSEQFSLESWVPVDGLQFDVCGGGGFVRVVDGEHCDKQLLCVKDGATVYVKASREAATVNHEIQNHGSYPRCAFLDSEGKVFDSKVSLKDDLTLDDPDHEVIRESDEKVLLKSANKSEFDDRVASLQSTFIRSLLSNAEQQAPQEQQQHSADEHEDEEEDEGEHDDLQLDSAVPPAAAAHAFLSEGELLSPENALFWEIGMFKNVMGFLLFGVANSVAVPDTDKLPVERPRVVDQRLLRSCVFLSLSNREKTSQLRKCIHPEVYHYLLEVLTFASPYRGGHNSNHQVSINASNKVVTVAQRSLRWAWAGVNANGDHKSFIFVVRELVPLWYEVLDNMARFPAENLDEKMRMQLFQMIIREVQMVDGTSCGMRIPGQIMSRDEFRTGVPRLPTRNWTKAEIKALAGRKLGIIQAAAQQFEEGCATAARDSVIGLCGCSFPDYVRRLLSVCPEYEGRQYLLKMFFPFDDTTSKRRCVVC